MDINIYILYLGPAHHGCAGGGKGGAALYGEEGGAGGVVLLQRVIAQRAGGVPAHRLLRAGRQGVHRQA